MSPSKVLSIAGAVFLLAGGGNFFSQYLSGAYQSGMQTLGLLGASAAVGLAPAVPVLLAIWAPIREFFAQQWRKIVGLSVCVMLVLVSFFLLGPLVNRRLNDILGCAPPTEFTVVAAPAARATADDLLTAFEESTANKNYGCPTAHGFVYEAPEDTIKDAVAGGWRADGVGSVNPRRDVGPRPDVWMTESTMALNSLYDSSQASAIAENRSIGTSPLVLAVPGGVRAPAAGSFPEIVAEASRSIGVVRTDPDRSMAGLLATAALYGVNVDRSSETRSDTPVDADSIVEQRIGSAQSASAFPDADEGEVVCHFQALTGPRPALLLSEQAVRRSAGGLLVGKPCSSPEGSSGLNPVYSVTPTLDHRVVRLQWPDGPSPPSAVGEYERWLTSNEGLTAVGDTGLRPTIAGDPASSSLVERGDIDPGAVDGVRQRYQAAHQPRRDLLAVDSSGSMGEPDARGGTRFDQVKISVNDAACTVRPNDEIGLWTFPGDSDQRPRPVVPPTQGGCNAVIAAAASLVPRGNTPLFQTIVDGIAVLRDTDNVAERRLVVVTDGEDTTSGVDREAVLAALTGAQVKVYVVTLGDVTCDADPLQEVADLSGGRCYDPGATPRDLRDALSG